MKVRRRNEAGFTLVEMMIVVAVIGLLAAMAVPNLVRSRTTSQTNACINNLRQIDDAKQEWGMTGGISSNARPGSAELQPYLGRGSSGELPTCPIDPENSFDTSYTAGNLQVVPVCKIAPTTHVLVPASSISVTPQ